MLQFFKNIRLSSPVSIFIIGLLIRIPFFIEIPVKGTSLIPWFQEANSLFKNYYWISVLVAYLCIYFSAMMYNKVCIDHDVIYQHTFLPGYFMVLFSALYSGNIYFNASHIALVLLAVSFTYFFRLYHAEEVHGQLYTISALVCIAGFAIPGLFFLLVYIPIATIISKKISIKDVLAIVMGALTPLILYYGVLFIIQNKTFTLPALNFQIKDINLLKFQNFFGFIVILLLCTVGIFKALSNYRKNTIKTRRINVLLLMYLLFMLVLILFNLRHIDKFHLFTTFASAPIVSYFLLGSKHKKWKEAINIVILLIVLMSLYGIEIKFK